MDMKLVHIRWSAELGGAERAVFQLAQYQLSQGLKVAVAFGKAVGPFVERLQQAGVPVIDLGLQSAHELSALPRIRRLLAPYAIHHFHVAEPLIMLASLSLQSARRVYTYRAGEHRRSRKQQLPAFSAKYPPVHALGKEPQSLAGAPPPGDVRGRSAH